VDSQKAWYVLQNKSTGLYCDGLFGFTERIVHPDQIYEARGVAALTGEHKDMQSLLVWGTSKPSVVQMNNYIN